MSTRSNIVHQNDDGTVTVAYVHYDGYPSGVGRALEEHHRSLESSKALVSMGALRSVTPEVEAYNDGSESRTYGSMDEYMDAVRGSWPEYVYLFHNDHWVVMDPSGTRGWMLIEAAVEVYENSYK